MSKEAHGNGWKIGFWIVLALLILMGTADVYNRSQYRNAESTISQLKNQAQQTSSSSNNSASTPSTNSTAPAQTTTKQSWLCTDSVDMSLGGDIDSICTPSDGSTNSLTCMGNINTDLVTQYYPYANLNITCSTTPGS